MFWCDDVSCSNVCWGTCDPQFNFSQVMLVDDLAMVSYVHTVRTVRTYVRTYVRTIHTNLYSAKIVQRTNLRRWHWVTRRQKRDWKRWDFSWRLKVDNLSRERMCVVPGRRFGNRKCPSGEVTSDAIRSGQKICVGRAWISWWKVVGD